MSTSILSRLTKELEFCVKQIGKDTITPNILLHVLLSDSSVSSYLVLHHTDVKLLTYMVNPYHLYLKGVYKPKMSHEVKDILTQIEKGDTYQDIFFKSLKYRYIKETLLKAGFIDATETPGLLGKYTQRIRGGHIYEREIHRYEKVNQFIGRKNIMVMGAIGSGRYEFIKNYAKYNEKNFSLFYFDLFAYLKIEEERLFGIVSGVFEELHDDFLYIPNFLQTIEWIRSLKLFSIYTLLEEYAYKGKIITKTNSNNFDPKQFHLSAQWNFHAINLLSLHMDQLYEILNAQASVYERFYGIDITNEEIKGIVKEANDRDVSLAQPGKSLKRLMRLALTKYGRDEAILQEPHAREEKLTRVSLEEKLNEVIIGQRQAMSEVANEINKLDMPRIKVRTLLFEGEIGCGKLKTAATVSNMLFGENNLQYIDLSKFTDFPFKLRVYEILDDMVSSLYGGVVFLDNFEYFDTNEVDIITYITTKLKEVQDQVLSGPILVIASCRAPLTNLDNYPYILEHFDKVIVFNKLSIRDLEKIAEMQMKKVKHFIPEGKDINSFAVSANSNESLNALGVKKTINAMLA